MSLKIYNTLSRKKETFKSIEKGKVGMYVCGPTVNDVPHLGHARVQIVFDVFRKYLEFLNYKVNFVSNITDIDDKIINKASELGISIKELTKKNEKEHFEDYKSLGVKKPTIQPHATDYVLEMIDLVKILEEKKYTYIVPKDGIYFAVSKFEKYGKLSRINLEELKSNRQLKDQTKGQKKKDSKDFVLWKFSKPSDPEETKWDSPWGKGRPGWHIECSAMTHFILGNPFDIHAGGQDLIFPHHEDEIAQSEAAYGKKMCNYWIHNGMVNIDKIKMSKSLGNFKRIKDLLKEYSGETIRYFVLSTHYRKPIDFSKSKLEESKISLEKLRNLIQKIKDDKKTNKDYLKKFKKSMDDDLNTSETINLLWKLIKDKKAQGKYSTIKEIDKVLGLNLMKKEKINIPKEIKELAEKRLIAREEKNWKLSDKLRDKINKLGFSLKDTKEGYEIKKR
jgi:cysteinyl-tRNA synthetase